MNSASDDCLIDEYVKMVLVLATGSLDETDVSLSIKMIVFEACFYLSIERKNDTQSSLRTFEERLLEKADVADKCLSSYKRSIEEAASLVATVIVSREFGRPDRLGEMSAS